MAPQSPPVIYIFVAVFLQLASFIYRLFQTIRQFASVNPNKASIRAISYRELSREVTHVSDAIQIRLNLSNWKARAGQYVYLCIPGISKTAFMQSHPFYISWHQRGRYDEIVLIAEKRSGFTRSLFTSDGKHEQRCIVYGPYGRSLELGRYGTVIFYATGVGIAPHVFLIKEILEGIYTYTVSTQRIALFWEMEDDCASSTLP